MLFKLKPDQPTFNAYGYSFRSEPVDVQEDNLINKFKKYHQLEVVVEPKPEMSEKDQLRAECDSRGIEYDKRWGVKKLKEALA